MESATLRVRPDRGGVTGVLDVMLGSLVSKYDVVCGSDRVLDDEYSIYIRGKEIQEALSALRSDLPNHGFEIISEQKTE